MQRSGVHLNRSPVMKRKSFFVPVPGQTPARSSPSRPQVSIACSDNRAKRVIATRRPASSARRPGPTSATSNDSAASTGTQHHQAAAGTQQQAAIDSAEQAADNTSERQQEEFTDHAAADQDAATATEENVQFEEFGSRSVPTHGAAARSGQTNSQRSETAAANWEQYLGAAADRYVCTISKRSQLQQEHAAAVGQHVTAAASNGSCYTCGLLTSSCIVEKRVPVQLLDLSCCPKVVVPCFRCSRCRDAPLDPTQPRPSAGVFNLDPLEAGCFPATPVHAVQLHLAPTDCPPCWFTIRLLEHLLVQRQHIQRMALGKAAEALRECLEEQLYSSFPPQLTSGRFRKMLSSALEQYTRLRMTMQRPEMLGLPRESLVGVCHCCRSGVLPYLQKEGVSLGWVGQQHNDSTANHGSNEAPASAQSGPAREAAGPSSSAGQPSSPPSSVPRRSTNSSSEPATGSTATGNATGEAATPSSSSRQQAGAARACHSNSHAAETMGCKAATDDRTQGPGGNPVTMEGKQVYGKVGALIAVHTVLIDGLQKMRHFRKAGTVSGRTPVLMERLLTDVEFKLWDDGSLDESEAVPDLCNTFKADKATGRKSDMFDYSGIVTLLCRHGFLLAAVNMPTGERWAYAAFLMHVLMHEHNILPYILMYDINCRFKAYFQKWVESRSDWTEGQRRWAQEILQCPLPPFHVHMHQATCQAKNSLNLVNAGGTGVGEPTEQMNRYLGLAGVVLQYATLAGRALWLEALFEHWNKRKRQDLPRLLVESGCRALTQRKQQSERQAELARQAFRRARELGWATADATAMIRSWGSAPATPAESSAPAPSSLPWNAEIAELLVALDLLCNREIQLLPKELIRRELGLQTAAVAHREKRLEQLQQQYPESRGWDATSLALRTAVAVLCSCKVSMLQLHVEHLVRLHSYTKWLQTSLGDTSRKETKKLELEKNRLYQQISDDLRSAVEWETQRQRYKEHMPSDTAGHPTQDSNWHSRPVKDLLEQLCNGILPWEGHQAGQVAGLDPMLARLKQQMGIVALDLRAAKQELNLIDHEISQYVHNIQQERQLLQLTMSQHAAELATTLQQQDGIEEGLAAATSPCLQYDLQCKLHQLDTVVLRLQGRRLLLQQRLDATSKLQAMALARFRRYRSGSLADIAAGAAAAVFAESADRAAAADGESDCDICSDDESECGVEDAAAAQQQQGDEDGIDGEPAVPQAPMPTLVLQPLRSWQPIDGPDGVVEGRMPQQAWVDQLPPWQAPPADVDRLQQWQDTGVLPTELASLLTDGGVITLANNGQLSLEQLQRLLPGKWLNDELINYAMWLYQQRDACMQGITHPWFAPQWSAAPGFSCHFFNSFFMAKLYLDACRAGQCKPGQIKYAAVRRWTTLGNLQRAGQARFGTGVLSCRLLIAPCNLGNSHWVLVVADLELRRLLYLDSAGGRRTDIADAMAAYVKAEAYDKKQQWWDTDSWPRVFPAVPRQQDGYSCGLYAAVFADCLGAGVPLQHCQLSPETVDYVRANLLSAICTGSRLL